MEINLQNGHVYVIGSTGVGKSTLLESEAKGAFAFIDKHGTTARRLADSMQCIYWRPADLEFPIGLNPLHNVPSDLRWKVTAEIVSIFADVWGLGTETPRLLYYLRAAVRLLLDSNHATLLDIRSLLTDGSFRNNLLHKCSDLQTRQTWKEYDAKSAKDQSIEIASLQNKVAALADPLPLRYVIGQPTSTLDIGKVIATGTPLIVDLSGMGDEPAHLLGAIIINTFKQEAENHFIDTRSLPRFGDRGLNW